MTVVKIKKQKAEKSVWHTLQSGPGPWPSEKANTGPLQKVDSIPKLAVWVKDTLMTNLRVLNSSMTILS